MRLVLRSTNGVALGLRGRGLTGTWIIMHPSHAGDDAAYRQLPVVNNSWIGHPMSFRNLKSGLVGLGLKAPMHLNFNLTKLRETLPGLSSFVAAAAIDGGCDVGGAYAPGAPLDVRRHAQVTNSLRHER